MRYKRFFWVGNVLKNYIRAATINFSNDLKSFQFVGSKIHKKEYSCLEKKILE